MEALAVYTWMAKPDLAAALRGGMGVVFPQEGLQRTCPTHKL